MKCEGSGKGQSTGQLWGKRTYIDVHIAIGQNTLYRFWFSRSK